MCQLLTVRVSEQVVHVVVLAHSSLNGALHAQVYKALRNNVQECAVKRLRNVNKTELANFQRVCSSTLEAYHHTVSAMNSVNLLLCKSERVSS